MGSSTADVTEDAKRRIQIREVIRAHLEKESELFASGRQGVVSVLHRRGRQVPRLRAAGHARRIRSRVRGRVRGGGRLTISANCHSTPRNTARISKGSPAVHAPGVLLDRQEDQAAGRWRGEEERRRKGTVDRRRRLRPDPEGEGAPPLVRRAGPIRLLPLGAPRRLGQPERFAMGMLKKSDNTVSRRQEIGRGLRLAVNQKGERMDNPATVHDINELTVVTDESYTSS